GPDLEMAGRGAQLARRHGRRRSAHASRLRHPFVGDTEHFIQGVEAKMSGQKTDVIVIGAGPYGLAASAHLRGAGANVRGLGKPMSFWMRHMPKGMRLRSPW